MMNGLARLFLSAVLALLVACGDDGGAVFDPDGEVDEGAVEQNSVVSNLALYTDSPQMGTASSEEVALTVVAKDSENRVVAGEEIAFSAGSGDLSVTQSTTDDGGRATALFSPGGDASNRTVTITAQAGSASSSTTIELSGTQISASGATSVVLGAETTLTFTVKDSAGNGVSGAPVTIVSSNGNTLGASTLDTDGSGQIQVSFTGNTGGLDTITASALNASATHEISVSGDAFQLTAPQEIKIDTCTALTVSWLSDVEGVVGPVVGQVDFLASRGTFYTDATCTTTPSTSITTNAAGEGTIYIHSANSGPVSITATGDGGPSASADSEFVASVPNTLILQAAETTISTNEDVTVTATVRDANFNLVKGATVNFQHDDQIAGSLSTVSAVTDSLGRASTVYTAADQSSATDGVLITATAASNTAITDSVNLTVAEASLFISLGMATKIAILDDSTYQYPGSVLVADSAGNPVADQDVTLTLVVESYDKGFRNEDAVAISSVLGGGVDSTFAVFAITGNLSCANEDINQNGLLDDGEDINGSEELEPKTGAAVTNRITTDDNGHASFEITYLNKFANWTAVKVRASTEVGGSESLTSTRFVLPMEKDADPPPSVISPFGIANDCTNPD